MKKKFGFTLAEVLITLGIIGVVAALTAPALVKNSGTAKIGPSLAKFVNTFESAAEQLMVDEGTSTLTSAKGSQSLGDALSKYMIMSPSSEKHTSYLANGKVRENWKNISGYIMKDGTWVTFGTWEPTQWEDWNDEKAAKTFQNQSLKKVIGQAIVDINGLSGNNVIGKEVFGFYITDSGILIPYGGNLCKSIYTWDTTTCDPNASSPRATACTGAIADNGWKADSTIGY